MDKQLKQTDVVKTAAQKTPVPPRLSFSDNPTDNDISTARVFIYPLVPMTSAPIAGENARLATALMAFKTKSDADDVSDLVDFIGAVPDSRWRASLECILGQLRLDRGYFSDALTYWTSSWERSQAESGARQKAVADEAVSRLMALYGRLGEQDTLAKYLADVKGRIFFGSVDTRVFGARMQLAQMVHRPEMAFKCGPAALFALAAGCPSPANTLQIIAGAHSTRQGTNLAQLVDWSQEIGLDYIAAHRDAGAPFVTPCLVHWTVGHFAAITARDGDSFTIMDHTFGSSRSSKISALALEAQSDGFFLVPPGPLPAGWQNVSRAQAAAVWGKGASPARDNNAKTPHCPKTPMPDNNCHTAGMAKAAAFTMQASLNISDTPLSYQPAIGSTIDFTVNFNYQEVGQPSPGMYTFSNLGPNWSINWVSYVQGDAPSTHPAATVFVRGGGSEVYAAADPYTHDLYSQALLVGASGYYQRDLPDGSSEIFAAYDGTSNYFLTSVIDAQGNSTEISYDDTFRVTAVTDSFGQVSTFDYGSDTEGNAAYYTITQINDPYGRSAVFQYDPTYTNLLSITDQIGMTSSFIYSVPLPSLIATMVTPYGQTNFEVYEPSDIATGIKVTFPDNSVSQMESWIGLPMKTYYWDRWAMTLYPNDWQNEIYTNCVTTHWLSEPIIEIQTAVPFWVQPPLEDTTWYFYKGIVWNQYPPAPDHYWLGAQTINKPIQIMRTSPGSIPPVLDPVQTWTVDYGTNPKSNSFGYPIQTQDALATPRIFDYNYAGNNIDLLSVKQDSTGELLSQLTYNDQHLPLTSADGSGNVTQMTYNDQGQPLTVTDAYGNVTTLSYSAQPAIIGGTVESGDTKVLSVTISNSSLPGGSKTKDYTVESGNDLSSIALGLAAAINADTDLQAADISATWVAVEPASQTPAVYINSFSADATTYSVSTSGTGAETITLATAACGYLMQVQGPLGAGNIVDFSYDEIGRLYTTTNSEGYTITRLYDDLDRIVQLSYPDGTSDRLVYNKLDVVATYDRLGAAHQYAFNSVDQLAYEIDAVGRKTQYSWCRCGALKQLTDANGNTTSWDYDLQGRLVTKTYQDNTTLQISYDSLGRVATKVDALGQVTTMSYNLDNTIAEIVYSNTINATPTVAYSYDDNFPRVTEVKNYTTSPTSPIADLLYSFNPNIGSTGDKAYIFIGGYPETPDATDTIDVTFFNSALGGGEYALPTFTVPTGDPGDTDGVASALASGISSNATLSAAGISAVATGTLVTISAGSAITVSPSATGSTTATLGGGGMLASVTNSVIANSPISYGYDALSRTVARMINGGNNASAYSFDAISRLTSESNALGTFDYAYINDMSGSSKGDPRLASISYPNGQVTNFSYYPTVLDERLLQIGNLTSTGTTLSQFDHAYDPTGRITQWPQLQNNSSSFYQLAYDKVGQLIAAQAGSGTQTWPDLKQNYYSYDAGANRTSVQAVAAVNARIAGTATAADVLTISVSDPALSGGEQAVTYTVQGGDTLAAVAAGLAAAVNVNANLQTLGVNAVSSGAILTLRSVSANVTTYNQSVSDGASETITLGATANFVVNATIGGSKTTGDTITLTTFDTNLSGGSHAVSYTVLSGDTLSSIASGLTSAINADSDLTALGVSATAAGAVITLRSTSVNATTYSQSVSSGASETVTLAVNPNGGQVVAIGGSKTTGDTLTLRFYDVGLSGGLENVTYTVLSGDTLGTAAAGLASAINADTALQGIGLSATSSGTFITIQSNSTNLTMYRQALSSGATETITLNVPMNGIQTAVITGSKTTGDVVTLIVFDAGLSGGSEAVSHTVLSGDTLADIAAAMAAAISADTNLQAINVSATSTATVVYITSGSANATTYAQSVSSGATETITLGISTGVSHFVYNNVNELVAVLPGGDAYFEGLTNKAVNSVTISSDAIAIHYAQVNYPSYSVSTSSGGSSETLTLGTLINGGDTVTVGGSVLTVTTIAPALSGGQHAVSYTVQADDTFTSIATGIAAAINADASLAAIGVSATSSSAVITIVLNPPTYTVATSSGATETITLGTSVLGNVTVKIGGQKTTGDTLTVTTSNIALPGGSAAKTYTVLSDDTLPSIAAGLAALINGDSDLAGIGVSAIGATAANMAWSESYGGRAELAVGMNTVTVTAVDAVPNTKGITLQLSATGAESHALTYDLNGNMTSDGTNGYEWDGENRLVKITYPGSGNNTAFAYDGLSQCVTIVETRAGSVTSTKQFVWSGSQRCETRDASSTVTAQFFGFGEVIGVTSYYYTRDHLGSIREMTNGSGTIEAQYEYGMFGEVTQTIANQSADFGYAGMYFHTPSALNMATYRAYNPSLGRWINRDPIGEEGGINLYDYVDNDPIGDSDPDGTQGITILTRGAAAMIIAGAAAEWQRTHPCPTKLPPVLPPTTGTPPWVPPWIPPWVGPYVPPIIIYIVQSVGGMNQQIKKGQAPKGVIKVHSAHNPEAGGQPHVHVENGGNKGAINQDGSIKEGNPNVTNEIKRWLQSHGWTAP